MFNLLHELHFWTQKDGVSIADVDFGAFMYYEKKNVSSCLLYEGKKSYAESRGISWSLSNKRPRRLKESLKDLEELLYGSRILTISWRNNTSVQIFFGNGLMSYVKVNPTTGDIEDIGFDKFMIGRLSNHYVSDVSVCSSHAIFAYSDNQVTLVHFAKPSLRFGPAKKWSSLETKINHFQLSGPSGRRLDKLLSLNCTSDLIAVWWKSSNDEVYPWSPIVKDEDRANVHIYSLCRNSLELFCFYQTEFEPINILFSNTQPNVVFILQQKVSKKNEVTIEWTTAEVACTQFETNYTISILLPTHSCSVALSPKEDKVFVACIDGSLLIADSYGNIMNTVKAAFIPILSSWHPDGCLILIGNERGQLQWFDGHLNNVKSQFISEDYTPSAVLDIGSYFKYQPTLLSMNWNRKSKKLNIFSDNDLLLLHFEKGPLVVLRLISISSEQKFSADVVASLYLFERSYEKALTILYSLDWEHEGDIALSTLQIIVSNLLNGHLTPEKEGYLERALGSFHTPIRPIPENIDSEYVDCVHDLTRRFFHHLLRYKVFEKAFCLAIDLEDYDLFMDLYNYCKKIGNVEMARAAFLRAEEIQCYSNSVSTDSDCSNSSCSCHSSVSDEISQKKIPPLPLLCIPKPAPRNSIKHSHKLQLNTQYPSTSRTVMLDISPNTVGIPISPEDTGTTIFSDSVKTIHHPFSTNFSEFNNSINSRQEATKSSKSESGKIKVVHFGLV